MCLHTQMGSFVEGDLQLPAQTGSGSGPPPGRYRAGPEWRRSPGGLGSAPSTQYQATAALAQENFQRRPPRALQWRATVLARLTGWRWRIQGGVQTQSGDQGNGFTEGLAPRPPAPGVGASPMASGPGHVAQPHQGDPAQTEPDGPRPDLGAATPFQGLVDAEREFHGAGDAVVPPSGPSASGLADLRLSNFCTVGELLVLASLLLVVTGRRRQHREQVQLGGCRA